ADPAAERGVSPGNVALLFVDMKWWSFLRCQCLGVGLSLEPNHGPAAGKFAPFLDSVDDDGRVLLIVVVADGDRERVALAEAETRVALPVADLPLQSVAIPFLGDLNLPVVFLAVPGVSHAFVIPDEVGFRCHCGRWGKRETNCDEAPSFQQRTDAHE